MPRTRLGKGVEIPADALELCSRHLDRRGILRLRNGQVFLVNVHQLDIVLAETVGLSALEHQVDSIGRVLRLQRENVFILGGAQDLGQRGQVDAQGNVAVAAVRREALRLQKHGHQGNMGVVHGLEGNSRVIAVEVAVLHKIFDGLNDLGGEQMSITGHAEVAIDAHTRLRREACSRRASNTAEIVRIRSP